MDAFTAGFTALSNVTQLTSQIVALRNSNDIAGAAAKAKVLEAEAHITSVCLAAAADPNNLEKMAAAQALQGI